MEQHEEFKENVQFSPPTNRSLVVAVVVALVIALISFGYGFHQQAVVQQLSAHESANNASVSQMQESVASLTAKMDDLAAAQRLAADAAAKQAEQAAKKGKGRSVTDTRYKKLEAGLADQQKQLEETRGQVAQNRAELADSLSSTRDELNGSIARTHEELVALERRGERNYYEFDIAKSKGFSHVGPLMLSLRKADTKHRHYDLSMIVDDNRLDKKNVNLYEPVWLNTETEAQPFQIVVNKIGKNNVHGYVSAPKVGRGQVASGASGHTPATGNSPDTSSSAPASPQPQHPETSPDPQRPVRHPDEPPAQPQQPTQPDRP